MYGTSYQLKDRAYSERALELIAVGTVAEKNNIQGLKEGIVTLLGHNLQRQRLPIQRTLDIMITLRGRVIGQDIRVCLENHCDIHFWRLIELTTLKKLCEDDIDYAASLFTDPRTVGDYCFPQRYRLDRIIAPFEKIARSKCNDPQLGNEWLFTMVKAASRMVHRRPEKGTGFALPSMLHTLLSSPVGERAHRADFEPCLAAFCALIKGGPGRQDTESEQSCDDEYPDDDERSSDVAE